MVFKEVEHVRRNTFHSLPTVCNGSSRVVRTHHTSQSIIEINFVVEVIEAALFDEITVELYIIYFSNEFDVRVVILHVRYCPLPKFQRNHVYHVATESIDTF